MIDLSRMEAVQTRVQTLQHQLLGQLRHPTKHFQAQLNKEISRVQKMDNAQNFEGKQTGKVAHGAVNFPDIRREDNGELARRIARQVARPAGASGADELSEENARLKGIRAMVQKAAETYQVDPKLIYAVAEVESGGNQAAVSPAGAVGVMQLMPETARGLGVNPYNEQENIEGGAKYLREMLDTFGGDVRKAIAAYNAGPQAVKAYGDVPPYRETQNYVDKVLDLYQ